jgi:hypothetical protein
VSREEEKPGLLEAEEEGLGLSWVWVLMGRRED